MEKRMVAKTKESKWVLELLIILAHLAVFFAVVENKWPSQKNDIPITFTGEVQNPFLFNITVHDASLRGFLLLSPFAPFKANQGRILIMDMNGRTYFEKELHQLAYDFRQWRLNNKIYYSYMVNDNGAYHVRGIKLTAGHAVLLDSALREIAQMHLLPHDGITTTRHQDLDLHELILLSERHYIAIAAYEKEPDNIPAQLHPAPGIKVVAPVIQEVDNNVVKWQWDATDHPELYATSTEHNHFSDAGMAQDYLHINSLFLDPLDSNLICSFRGSSQVIKINRHNGAILWRLGGNNSDFKLTREQQFLRQHDVTITPGHHSLLMLDNGDSVLRKSSRILQFSLDERRKKVTSFLSIPIPDTPCLFMGNVTKQANDWFIGGGTGLNVQELDASTGHLKFQMKINQISYRAYKVDSIYGLEQRAPQ